jgi:hypothetical protein
MTGVRIGCVNCEPYVRQVTSKDSAFVYSSVFPEDLKYEVYYGDTKLDGVLEVKVGMGGYIIQVREDKYRGAHSCPCTQEVEDMRVCTAYIPGNHYRVEEPRTAGLEMLTRHDLKVLVVEAWDAGSWCGADLH